MQRGLLHWVLYGIAATVRALPEGVPRQDTVASIGSQGVNDFGEVGYRGPRPPPGCLVRVDLIGRYQRT
jgi:phosphatidylethanolamine-binding protein (PEBP) family uncharacterized protein